MREHLHDECKISLKNGTFYFKYDKKDKLYLIYSAGIQAIALNSQDNS